MKIFNKHILAALLAFSLCLSVTSAVLAQGSTGSNLGDGSAGGNVGSGSTGGNVGNGSTGGNISPLRLTNPLKVNSIGGLVQALIDIFSYIVILLAVLYIIWIGFQFVLARGNPTELSKLKTQLMWTVVGVAVVIGARVAVDVVINTLKATGTINPSVIQSAENAARGH